MNKTAATLDNGKQGQSQGIIGRLRSLTSRAYAKLDKSARLTIITLHRVGSGESITPDHIRHHFQFLARHYQVVVPSTMSRKQNGRQAIITIDDCHRDIYTNIFPVAREYGLPITICVPTDFFFRNHWLWFDRLYWMLERATKTATVTIEGAVFHIGNEKLVSNLKALLKRKLPDERNVLLSSIAEQLDCTPPLFPSEGYEAVSQTQMREMLESGLVELCAHTVTHTIATVLPDNMLRNELNDSKRELEVFCGRDVTSFCYPNGQIGDFDERTTQAVREQGFELAFTSIEGTNRAGRIDPYRLKRVHAHAMPSIFEKEASGIGDVQRRLKQSF